GVRSAAAAHGRGRGILRLRGARLAARAGSSPEL
ncbi:MAG: hypothetical protein AVDCRST_MAG16-2075, partial [uncultured Frankineae bacterium]